VRKIFDEPPVKMTIKLPIGLVRWIDTQAAQRHVTRTKVIFDYLTAQQKIVEELSKGFTVNPEEGHAQLLHSLLNTQTKTITASLDRVAKQLIELGAGMDRMVGLSGTQHYQRWLSETKALIERNKA
jgi:hypothetical protein